MRLCPYCGNEASSVGWEDETLDWCGECEVVIEGQTIDDELNELAEQQFQEWWQLIDQDEEWIAEHF